MITFCSGREPVDDGRDLSPPPYQPKPYLSAAHAFSSDFPRQQNQVFYQKNLDRRGDNDGTVVFASLADRMAMKVGRRIVVTYYALTYLYIIC